MKTQQTDDTKSGQLLALKLVANLLLSPLLLAASQQPLLHSSLLPLGYQALNIQTNIQNNKEVRK